MITKQANVKCLARCYQQHSRSILSGPVAGVLAARPVVLPWMHWRANPIVRGRGPACLACVVTFMWWDAHVAFTPLEWKVAWRFVFFFFVPEEYSRGTWLFLFRIFSDTPCCFFFVLMEFFSSFDFFCFRFLFNLLNSWCAKFCGSRSNLHTGSRVVYTILLRFGPSSGLLCRLVDSLAHLNIFAFVTVMLHHFTPVLLTHQNTRTFEV